MRKHASRKIYTELYKNVSETRNSSSGGGGGLHREEIVIVAASRCSWSSTSVSSRFTLGSSQYCSLFPSGVKKKHGFPHLAEAEIGNLEVPDTVAAQDVLGLEIPVDDAHLVKIGHALHQGLDHRECLEKTHKPRVGRVKRLELWGSSNQHVITSQISIVALM